MPKSRKIRRTDKHTLAAIDIATNDYFVVNDASHNEVPGLLIGTGVKKISEPEPRKSIHWKNTDYWSVLVLTPNGETRRISCDALTPADNLLFESQKKLFLQVA